MMYHISEDLNHEDYVSLLLFVQLEICTRSLWFYGGVS